MPQGLLRRQEPRRPEIRARRPEREPEPEPGHPRPVLGQQDVRGIEIPVYQPRVMDGAQGLRQPGGQRPHGSGRHRSVVADRLGQRRPGDVRRGQPRHVSVQVRGDHRHRERPVHPAGRGDLGPEPGIRGHVGPDDPHRDAFPARRPAQEQPATAQRLEQLVRSERARLLRRKRHYHPESPLLVAVTAIPRQVDTKPRSQICIRARPDRPAGTADRAGQPAVTRLPQPRNDFGTVRAYGCLIPVALVMKCADLESR